MTNALPEERHRPETTAPTAPAQQRVHLIPLGGAINDAAELTGPRGLRQMTESWADLRAQLLIQVPLDMGAILKLDRQFEQTLIEAAPVLQNSPGLLAGLRHIAHDTQTRELERTVPLRLRECGIQVGMELVSRRSESGTVLPAHETAKSLIAQCGGSESLEQIFGNAVRHGVRRGVLVEKVAAAVHGKLRVTLCDSAGIAAQIERLEPHERQSLAQNFEERYGQPLLTAVRARTRGAGRALVIHLIQGQDLQAHGDKLYLALKNIWGVNHTAAADTLRQVPASSRKDFESLFLRTYGKHLKVSSMAEVFEKTVKNDKQRTLLAHIWNGDLLLADIHQTKLLLTSGNLLFRAKNLVTLVSLFEKMNVREFNNFQVYYCREFQSSLQKDVKAAPLPREYRELLGTFCSGFHSRESGLVDAHKLRCALAGIHRGWLGDLATGRSGSELQKLTERYEAVFSRSFAKDYKRITETKFGVIRSIFGDEYEAVKNLFVTGKLSKAELIAHCLFGPGTDADGIRAVLKGISKEESAALDAQYAQRFPGHRLRRDVAFEMFGDDHFDVTQLLRGAPETLAEHYQVLTERIEYEFSGPMAHPVKAALNSMFGRMMRRVWFVGGLIEGYDDEAQRLTHDASEVDRYYDAHFSREVGDSTHQLELEALIRRASVSADAFREAKNQLVDFFTNAVANNGGAIAVVATIALLHNIPAAIVLGGVTSLALRVAIKWSAKGPAYGLKEFVVDSLRASVAGTNLLTGRIAARQVIQSIIGTMTKTGLSTLVNVSSRLRVKQPSEHAHAISIETLAIESLHTESGSVSGKERLVGGMELAHASADGVWQRVRQAEHGI